MQELQQELEYQGHLDDDTHLFDYDSAEQAYRECVLSQEIQHGQSAA